MDAKYVRSGLDVLYLKGVVLYFRLGNMMNFRVDSNQVLLLLSLNLFLGPAVPSSALSTQTNRIYIQIFWDIMPCLLVNCFQIFRRNTLHSPPGSSSPSRLESSATTQ